LQRCVRHFSQQINANDSFLVTSLENIKFGILDFIFIVEERRKNFTRVLLHFFF